MKEIEFLDDREEKRKEELIKIETEEYLKEQDNEDKIRLELEFSDEPLERYNNDI